MEGNGSSSGVSLYSMLPNDWASGSRPPSVSAAQQQQPYLQSFAAHHGDEDEDEVEDEEVEYGQQGSGYEDYGEQQEEHNEEGEEVDEGEEAEQSYEEEPQQPHGYYMQPQQSAFSSYGSGFGSEHENVEQDEEVEEEEEEEEEAHGEQGLLQAGAGFMAPYGMPWYAGASSSGSVSTTSASSSFTNAASAFFGGGSRSNSFVYGGMSFAGALPGMAAPAGTLPLAMMGTDAAASAHESHDDDDKAEAEAGVHAELKEFPKHSQPWHQQDENDVYHAEEEVLDDDDEESQEDDDEPLPVPTATPAIASSSSSSSTLSLSSTKVDKQKEVTAGDSAAEVVSGQADESQPDFQRPVWVEDKYAASCAKCTVDFSTFKRRHHCRGCGKVFCADCSSCFLGLPPDFGYKTPQRTCRACYLQHSTVDYTKKYDTFGPEDAPLVVLLHGAAATRKSFALQIEALKSDYRLVVPDLPGHGSRDNQQFTMQTAMDVVEEVIRAHSPEKRAIIFGYGLGGFVAMSLAGARPYLCRAIVVGGAASNQTERGGLFLAILSLMWTSIPKPLLSRAGRVTLDKYTRISEELVNRLFLRPGIQYAAWPDILSAVGTNDFGKHLTLYPGPVLFFHGQHDNRHSEGEWSRAARKAKVEVIDDAGQWVLVDERYHARVSALVGGFIQDVFRMEEEEEKRKNEEREREIARRKSAQQPRAPAAGGQPPLPDNGAALFKDADWLFAKE